MDAVHRWGEASVHEVMAGLPDPPGYSSVRKMLSLLEGNILKHRCEGTKYIYHSVTSRQSASRSAVRHLLSTFFAGSAADAVNAILDVSSTRLTDDDLARIRQLTDRARNEGQ
ncbi:MAG: BlaI/MecI/CopY family transcriptional regulator [Pirellulaceae bacterium]